MKVLFEVGHPAHVHLFKYVILELEKGGHIIKIAVRERENMVKSLLEKYSMCPRRIFSAFITGVYNLVYILVAENQEVLQSVINVSSLRKERGFKRAEIFFADIHLNPKYLNLKIPLKNLNESACCGRNCGNCGRYMKKKCLGCPGTQWYNIRK